jgi:hypothetical protein
MSASRLDKDEGGLKTGSGTSNGATKGVLERTQVVERPEKYWN